MWGKIMTWLISIAGVAIKSVTEVALKLIGQKKQEEKETKADATIGALDSAGAGIRKEQEIEKKQDAVPADNVKKDDGSIDFSTWNKGG